MSNNCDLVSFSNLLRPGIRPIQENTTYCGMNHQALIHCGTRYTRPGSLIEAPGRSVTIAYYNNIPFCRDGVNSRAHSEALRIDVIPVHFGEEVKN